MVKFLKTCFRSKRDLEVALEISLAKCSKWERDLEFAEYRIKSSAERNASLLKANDAQSASIASLQRDLAAAHAKLLIQEETPPETLHGAGKRTRKPHVHLSHTERDEVRQWVALCRRGKSIQDIAKAYGISERTLHRIVKEARGRNS